MRIAVVTVVTLCAVWMLAVQAQEGGEGVTLLLAEHDTLGPYLTNAEGASLYLFLDDSEGVSTCVDRCTQTWPPLLVDGEPNAGEGVDAALLATTERDDGTLQVTYNGWPLYRFSRDIPGFTGGQGAGGTWYLVTPAGAGVGVEEPSAQDATATEGEEVDPELLARLMGQGRAIFAESCSVCHGAQGGGGEGPALAGNDNLSDGTHVARQIVRGSRLMPNFRNTLSDDEIAAVATFVQNAWGNEYGTTSVEEVKRAR